MDYKILNKIENPEDLKKIPGSDVSLLCEEIRDCLITTVSKNGGHLASNLGTVELTVALHRVFNSPKDSILFDVGHQSYTHKLLTGRFKNFSTIRTEGGVSGFMRPEESVHDPFITGHSSNSLSAAYGIYKAKMLSGDNSSVITVVGDGAFTGGMIYEALNNASNARGNFIVVLNDNKMSISRNVGALARYFTLIRSKNSYHSIKRKIKRSLEKIPFIGEKIATTIFNSKTMLKNAIYKSNVFETLGFDYYGPVDGHNLAELENIFKIAKRETRPVLIHAITQKGKGYLFAENDPKNYHGVSSFDIDEGAGKASGDNFSSVFGKTITELAEKDEKICAVTAAMSEGTGLYDFSRRFKNRFFDVGIAEQHAMTFSAGLASKGMKPYFAVYSSFLQRSFDQIIHDVAICKYPVRICVDRAGIVGEDGETHQGIFDAAFLSLVPNIQIYSPCYYSELSNILKNTVNTPHPVAYRYPRGVQGELFEELLSDNEFNITGSGDRAIITYGRISVNAYKAQQLLKKEGINVALIKLNKIYPFSSELLEKINSFNKVYFFEEGIRSGGIAEHLLSQINKDIEFDIYAIESEFVPSSSVNSALKKYKLDTDSIYKVIKGEA